MTTTRRTFLAAMAAGGAALAQSGSSVTHYVRYELGGAVSYGILDGKSIQPITGDLFGAREPAGDKVALDDVTLLYPCEPPKVLAVGLNYKSHLGDREPRKVDMNCVGGDPARDEQIER